MAAPKLTHCRNRTKHPFWVGHWANWASKNTKKKVHQPKSKKKAEDEQVYNRLRSQGHGGHSPSRWRRGRYAPTRKLRPEGLGKHIHRKVAVASAARHPQSCGNVSDNSASTECCSGCSGGTGCCTSAIGGSGGCTSFGSACSGSCVGSLGIASRLLLRLRRIGSLLAIVAVIVLFLLGVAELVG